MSATETWTPSLAIIDDLDWWGLKYTVVRVALELGIFTTIAAGQRTLQRIAAAVSASERGTRILLDALCPIGLLRKASGEYFLTPSAEAFLVRGKPTFCADAYLTFWRDRDHLTDAVRTGTATLDIPTPAMEDMWAGLTAAELLVWPQRVETARQRWAQLGISAETKPGLSLLDVACGPGTGSFVLAQADSSARVTAVDLPKVLAVTAQIAEQMGVRKQVTLLPGTLLDIEFPSGQFDIVLFGAILYYFSPANVTAILRKAHHALKPGGMVVIRTIMADEERCQNEMATLLAAEMLHDSREGEVYTFLQYKAFLEAAGFVDVGQHGDGLISAKRDSTMQPAA